MYKDMNIILCTTNLGKVSEFQSYFGTSDIVLKTAEKKIDVHEDGNSEKENAYKKARAYFDYYQVPVAAEDTALYVPSIGGLPGIHARYLSTLDIDLKTYSIKKIGNMTPDQSENPVRLLELLEGKIDRYAYFRSTICYIRSSGEEYFFEGTGEGRISEDISERSPEPDLPYDRVFEYEFTPGKWTKFSEVSKEIKNSVSHRGKDISTLREFCLSGINNS